MGFLSSLLGLSSSPSPDVEREIDLGHYIYLFDYTTHYRDFLALTANPTLAIAELFLFRGWVTQLGFRIASSHPEISERILGQTVNLTDTWGRVSLVAKHGVRFERLFPSDFMDILESRWQQYDSIFIQRRTEQNFVASFQICSAVASHCGVNDPLISMMLEPHYLSQLMEIKEDAIKRRILS